MLPSLRGTIRAERRSAGTTRRDRAGPHGGHDGRSAGERCFAPQRPQGWKDERSVSDPGPWVCARRARTGPHASRPGRPPYDGPRTRPSEGGETLTTLEDATVTPVVLGGARGGPDVPTLRKDRYWVQPVVTVTVLTAFVAYASWAAFVNKNYYVGAAAAPRPDLALLLALPDRQLRPGQPSGHRHHLVDHLPGPADPDLPAGLPADLLLLPQGLLPVLLAGAAGLRRVRRPRLLHR